MRRGVEHVESEALEGELARNVQRKYFQALLEI